MFQTKEISFCESVTGHVKVAGYPAQTVPEADNSPFKVGGVSPTGFLRAMTSIQGGFTVQFLRRRVMQT